MSSHGLTFFEDSHSRLIGLPASLLSGGFGALHKETRHVESQDPGRNDKFSWPNWIVVNCETPLCSLTVGSLLKNGCTSLDPRLSSAEIFEPAAIVARLTHPP